jgi:single-strand DNA-binding protein
VLKEINRVVLTGEVVSDAAFGHTARGSGVATFTLAFCSGDPDRGRQKGYIDVVCLGDAALRCVGVARQAEKVKVEGRLQHRSWTTPEGFHKSKMEIMAQTIEPYTDEGAPTSDENRRVTAPGRNFFETKAL